VGVPAGALARDCPFTNFQIPSPWFNQVESFWPSTETSLPLRLTAFSRRRDLALLNCRLVSAHRYVYRSEVIGSDLLDDQFRWLIASRRAGHFFRKYNGQFAPSAALISSTLHTRFALLPARGVPISPEQLNERIDVFVINYQLLRQDPHRT
jgi:hypothetical protein